MALALANDDLIRILVKHNLANSTTGQPFPNRHNIVNKTADYTILPTDPCGTNFTNGGDTGAIVFTLPAPSAALLGVWYRFTNIATTEQAMTVATATADTLITKNDVAADSIALSTSGAEIGGVMEFVCVDGTGAGTTYQWVGYGISVGHTFTVATA